MARHGTTVSDPQDRAVSIARTAPPWLQETPDDEHDKGNSEDKVQEVKGLHGAIGWR